MLRKDCHKPYWKERFIDGLPPIFAHKVKQVLMGTNDSFNYDNLTYDDVFSTIKKFCTSMCNNEKLLTHQLQIKKKANFCEQNNLPPIALSRQKGTKHDKSHKCYSHKKYKRYKNKFVKPNDFHDKKKNVSGKYKQLGKFNMLKIDNKDKKELFKILDDFFSLNLLNLLKMIPCKNIKFVKTLTKSEENEKSTLGCEETLKSLNKGKSKDLTVNDLQHEINIIKQEISKLKHKNRNNNTHIKPKLIMLKVGKSDNDHDEHKDGDESSQQALLSNKGITNASIDPQLALVNKILLPKWFTKVKIVVSTDYHFIVIAMID